jgi:hypothetical protein
VQLGSPGGAAWFIQLSSIVHVLERSPFRVL